MRKLYFKLVAGIGLAMLSPAVFAAQEDVMDFVAKLPMYAFFLFAIVVIIVVYTTRLRDKRRAPVVRLFDNRDAIHSVGPDTPVAECVRTMTSRKIGAVIVMDGEKLVGIFTERDALNKVLGAGLDPLSTKISEVMTKDPYCIPPGTTVSEAMEVVTRRRFRHLPIVENGKVLGVVSSGDLTHWLVQDKVGEVQELVGLAVRS
jgi:predicted transcriptional regulator